MSEIRKYELDIVRRSKKFIEENFASLVEQDLEVTLLINLVTLLASLVEANLSNYRRKESFANFLRMHPQRLATSPFNFSEDEIKRCETSLVNSPVPYKSTPGFKLQNFLKKLRNSLAHQNIKPINSEGEWRAVRVWNVRDGAIDFVLEMDSKSLFDFYIGLANAHINAI